VACIEEEVVRVDREEEEEAIRMEVREEEEAILMEVGEAEGEALRRVIETKKGKEVLCEPNCVDKKGKDCVKCRQLIKSLTL